MIKKLRFYFRQSCVLFVCILFVSNVYAQKFHNTDSWGKQGFSIVEERSGSLKINYSITEFEINRNDRASGMVNVSLPEHFLPNDAGMPDLPGSGRYIAIPQGADAVLKINNFRTEIIPNVDLAPALPIPADIDKTPQTYEKNGTAYSKNAFFPEQPVLLSEKTSIRGVDAVVLGITPFQYNPVTKELKVYYDISIEVTFENAKGGTFGDNRLRSPYFDPILYNTFLNYQSLEKVDYGNRYRKSRDVEGCEYLIVIPNDPEWRPYAEQIKEWRTKQGIITKIMSLEEIGQTSADGLKTFFHNAYRDWDIPPVAVLLMADYGTNPQNTIIAHTISHPYSGYCITDNIYADVTGNYMPDMIFARMAAENTQQLQVMVSKTLDYESAPPTDSSYYKNPITALGWQTVRWFQLCSEVVGGYWRLQGKEPVRINAIYEGTPGSQWSTANNTSSVINYFGPNGQGFIPQSPSELGGFNGGTAQQVVNAINAGAFALQHRDHGYVNGWGEPDFSSGHINQLTNVGKLTYVFSINCQTGKFDNYSPCFGELFHRHTYEGQNAGALGVLAPTEISYSFVNDCFVWGVFDFMDPDFLQSYGAFTSSDRTGNWMPAFGNANGKYFLQQSNWPYNTGDKLITYQMFTAHGDAFLRLFTEVPRELEISIPEIIPTETTAVEVSCPIGTLIACTIGDTIIAVEKAEQENFTITLPAIDSVVEITVTATKQNYYRYTQTIETVEVVSPISLEFSLDHANHVTLTWKESERSHPDAYNVYRNNELLLELMDATVYEDVPAENGIYKYYVTAIYRGLESEPTDSVTVVVDGLCIEMGSIDVNSETESGDILISWNAPLYEGLELLGYNIYRDEIVMNDTLINVLQFIDSTSFEEAGTHCYQVEVVYGDCSETLVSESKCVDVLNIKEINDAFPAIIFPNPANTVIHVAANRNISCVILYNMVGQMVKNATVNGKNADLSVVDIENGIYLLQIHSGGVSVTKKITVIH